MPFVKALFSIVQRRKCTWSIIIYMKVLSVKRFKRGVFQVIIFAFKKVITSKSVLC